MTYHWYSDPVLVSGSATYLYTVVGPSPSEKTSALSASPESSTDIVLDPQTVHQQPVYKVMLYQRRTDGRTDRRTDRQTERERGRESETYKYENMSYEIKC